MKTDEKNSEKNTTPVTLLFHKKEVTAAFQLLIESMGASTTIIETAEEIPMNTKIITEPTLYTLIPKEVRDNCLVVGDEDQRMSVEGPFLARPLTSEKIELGLKSFIGAKQDN